MNDLGNKNSVINSTLGGTQRPHRKPQAIPYTTTDKKEPQTVLRHGIRAHPLPPARPV